MAIYMVIDVINHIVFHQKLIRVSNVGLLRGKSQTFSAFAKLISPAGLLDLS